MKKILVLALSIMIAVVFLTGCSKKEKLFPIEMTEENILNIQVHTWDGHDITTDKLVNEVFYTLNEEDTKKAIKDINKLYKVNKYPEDEPPGAGAIITKASLYVNTKKGEVVFSPTQISKNKGVQMAFNMNDFPGEFDYVNLPGGELIRFYAQGVTSKSILREENLLNIIEEYKNGTRK